MRIIFSILVFLCFFYGISFADEIYMNDLSVIRGKIIQVTDKNVEYSQEGKPFLIVPREHVFRIKYDDGQVVQIADIKGRDKIFLKDGSVIEGTVIKATRDTVMYYTDQESVVPSDNVIKIVYANGKVMQISELPAEALTDAELETQTEEPVIRSGGFLDSYFRIGFLGGFSSMYGNLLQKEESAYESHRNDFTLYPGINDEDDYTYNTGIHGGFELCLMFPSIKYPQTIAFSVTGIKFGLKTTYLFSKIWQDIDDDSLPRSADYDGRLLKYRTLNAGPEMNIIFSPRTGLFNMIVKAYVLGGYIHGGKLTAAPGLRDGRQSQGLPGFDKSQYTSDFTGYSGTIGLGLHVAINEGFPVTIGYDTYYTFSRIKFNRSVPLYNDSKSTSFYEFGILLYAGVHL
ncbi:MAG: hypothetical protein JXN64_08510 [Spirochaetes bacterium]|nr:hypothetical protein [Spirochaetota bacterium]